MDQGTKHVRMAGRNTDLVSDQIPQSGRVLFVDQPAGTLLSKHYGRFLIDKEIVRPITLFLNGLGFM